MSRKLVLKRLKASDLSFFDAYLTRNPKGKQKGFNLDRDIFEDRLFPSIEADIAATPGQRAPVALRLFGPGGAMPDPDPLMRKVLKQQKNWRLNGEVINSPAGNPGRYDSLAAGDLAVMEFFGGGMPNAANVLLLAAVDPKDATVHAAFTVAFPGSSMTLFTEDQLDAVLKGGDIPTDHPIHAWLGGELLEDVGNGDAAATEALFKRRRGRGMTLAELKKTKESAEEAGRLGEELLDYYLASAARPPEIASYEWTAYVNAVSPFDFLLTLADASLRHADAKSTTGPFSNPIYLSLAEIRHALSSGVSYDIYRLYNVKDGGAMLRVARDIAGHLAPVVASLQSLPAGVKVDSLSFGPEYFDFDSAVTNIEYVEET